MLYRYAKLLKQGSTVSEDTLDQFADSNSVSGWAKEGLAWCVENDILRFVQYEQKFAPIFVIENAWF